MDPDRLLRKGRIRRALFRGRPSERGAAVVEFAVVLPIVLLILFGIIEFGFVMANLHLANNAAREGARVAVLPSSTNVGVEARVGEVIGLNVTYNVDTDPVDVSDADRGEPVEVTVTISYNSLFGTFVLGSSNMDLQGRAVMRKEG